MGFTTENVGRICELIDRHWWELYQDQRDEIELANKSIKFFIEVEDFNRVDIECNKIMNILNSIEKWI